MYLRVDAAGVEQLRRAAVEYGFSIAETARTNREGPTQSGQNSYMAPQPRVRRRARTVPKEMWQRSFGETVSPQLSNQCSAIFAGSWRNRAYTPAQTLASPSFVFGTCMETCDAMTSLGEQSGRTIEIYPAFLGERERSGRNSAFLGAASPGDERFGNGAAFELGGVALCALVAAAALARERIGQESQGLRGSENGQRGGKKDAECHVRCAEWVRNTTIITEYCYVHGSANESFLQ